MSRGQALLNAFAIAFAVVYPHFHVWRRSYAFLVLLVVWVALRYDRESFRDIGLDRRGLDWRAALVGSFAAVAILGVMQLAVFPLLESFIEFGEGDTSLYEFARANQVQFLMTVAMGWLIGGVYEEIAFHGFIFTRLERMLPGRYSTALSFVVTSALFGAYHLQLGTAGAFNALIVGSVYLSLYLAFGRNLCAAMICHGVYNTVVLSLVYHGHL